MSFSCGGTAAIGSRAKADADLRRTFELLVSSSGYLPSPLRPCQFGYRLVRAPECADPGLLVTAEVVDDAARHVTLSRSRVPVKTLLCSALERFRSAPEVERITQFAYSPPAA